MTGMSRSRCALREENGIIEAGGGWWVTKMGVILTQLHGGDSRHPAFCVSGRHIVDLKDQLEHPSRRV